MESELSVSQKTSSVADTTTSSSRLILPLDRSLVPNFVSNPNPEIYLVDNYALVDFECSNLDKGSAVNPGNRRLLAVCRLGPSHPQALDGGPEGRTRVYAGSEYEQSRLLRVIEEADFIVAHNAKFELQWLRRCGLDLRSVLPYCTQ